MTLTTEQLNSSNEKMCDGDSVETIEKNPKSWAAWKREAERLQQIIDANREAQPEYGDAYQGAREDLSIWKRQALEAEDKVRHLERVNDHLVKE
ncbi:hypothetical protein REA11_24360, partial [Serratia sp. MF1(2023)]|nr:hypothetical protein [Serratia sp. MF2]